MIGFLRDFRIIPVVLFATACLLALKVVGIVRGSGYVLSDTPFLGEILTTRITDARMAKTDSNLETRIVQADEVVRTTQPKQSWAQEMFNYPDVTGSVPEKKPAGAASESKPAAPGQQNANKRKGEDPPKDSGGTPVNLDPNKIVSPAERAILERLQQRRQEMDARERQMDIRESMLKAAETHLEARVAELKAMEARLNTSEHAKEEADAGRFKDLVSMYENMKPKEAAKVFDRLELSVLVQVTSLINPRKMSEILGQMAPEAAERLTVEMATRASGDQRSTNIADLPKIQGRPAGSP